MSKIYKGKTKEDKEVEITVEHHGFNGICGDAIYYITIKGLKHERRSRVFGDNSVEEILKKYKANE